jgi:Tfp pilus assembly protein FimT
MLAVVGIMLVLMVTAFGVFSSFAQRAGPDTAVSTVQAMLNGARDYAASNGVLTAVRFKVDMTKPELGTIMQLCWKQVGATAWTDVRGRTPISLGENMYVCRDLPPAIAAPLTVGNAKSESEIANWKTQYEAKLTGPGGQITNHVAPDGKQVDATNKANFFVVFDPAGYLKNLPDSGSDKYASNGLTVVQLFQVTTGAGGARVIAYALYPFNSMSGTRLIFDF